MTSADAKKKLGFVVSFSSNERPFLEAQISQLYKCHEDVQIVYSVGTHLYDMRPEVDLVTPLIETLDYSSKVSVVRYPVDADVSKIPRKYHNLAREAGVSRLSEDVEWVIFLDADEIPDSLAFSQWYSQLHTNLQNTLVYKLACYWYFVKPTWRATTIEDSIVLVHKSQLTPDALRDPLERDGIVNKCLGGHMRMIKSLQNRPMFHHFSWVRRVEQVIHKVKTWGHKGDRGDWVDVVERTWSLREPPPEGDFIHKYKYEVTDDIFNLSREFEIVNSKREL